MKRAQAFKTGLYPNDQRTCWPGLPIAIWADKMTNTQMLMCLQVVSRNDPAFFEAILQDPDGMREQILKASCTSHHPFALRYPWFFRLELDHKENVMECMERLKACDASEVRAGIKRLE